MQGLAIASCAAFFLSVAKVNDYRTVVKPKVLVYRQSCTEFHLEKCDREVSFSSMMYV